MIVSIIVITYNSSKYVLETLESAYRQTYRDIELIVSDDCSTDNTFELCQQWVEEHKDRFVRTLCTQTPHNGGIVWNYNHALKHAQGEWIKYIAGDDILCNNCIKILVRNIKPNIFLYFSSFYRWNIINNQVDLQKVLLPNKHWRAQFYYILRRLPALPGITLFIKRNHLIYLGGFDTRYPYSEDFQIALLHLIQKFQIGINNEPIAIWRLHSCNTSSNISLFGPSVFNCVQFYTQKYYWRFGLFFHQFHYFCQSYINKNYKHGGIKRMIGYFLRTIDIVYWKRQCFPVNEMGYFTAKTIPFSPDLIANHEYDPK